MHHSGSMMDVFASMCGMVQELRRSCHCARTSTAGPPLTLRAFSACSAFVFMIAHDPDAARRIRERLTRQPPNELARFFDVAIDPHGLQVTRL